MKYIYMNLLLEQKCDTLQQYIHQLGGLTYFKLLSPYLRSVFGSDLESASEEKKLYKNLYPGKYSGSDLFYPLPFEDSESFVSASFHSLSMPLLTACPYFC